MDKFPHLKFSEKIIGSARNFGGGEAHEISKKNKENRQAHSGKLQKWISNYKDDWNESYENRDAQNLAPINAEIQPIFLQVNPDIINAEFNLEKFGIEIISEEENGFIIGASLDNFRSLEDKVNDFITAKHNSGKIADFWQIFEGNRESWKPQHILSKELFEKWSKIEDDSIYELEISIAFDKPIGKAPKPEVRGYERKLEIYRNKLIERDDFILERQNHFQAFIEHYGTITSGIVELEDSFACEVKINGLGLKDLVVNYQFVFEVAEVDNIEGGNSEHSQSPNYDIEVLRPDEESPEIGVIDSGIMENHKYIEPSILSENSKSYVDGINSTADEVKGGGHGTKVAGAILYPKGVSHIQSPYQLPFFVRNIRVLNQNNKLTNRFPAELMKTIVEDNKECKIFNLSLNSSAPHRIKHMSTWASMLDTLTHEKGVLFINSTGNISEIEIKHQLANGNNYPSYLEADNYRIANPSQSSFSLSVGSVNHLSLDEEFWSSIGNEDEVSSFSRVGMGIWGKIKPEVVEYGGTQKVSKDGNFLVSTKGTSIELVNSTLHGGAAYSSDSVGTSFSAPKVSHIVGQLKKLYPNENINLLRALVVHGARIPNGHFKNPTKQAIQFYGYGIPSLERVTKNTEHRVTFYSTNSISAEEGQIYSLKIPDSIRNQGDDFDVLIEVTLAYTAKVRRTRQKTKSYLSTWLDWKTSKINESYDKFREFALKRIDGRETSYDRDARGELNSFKWKIHNRSDYGEAKGVNRNNSTVQKDWAIIKSYELSKELSFVVSGHRGWDKNKEEVPYALTVSLEVLGANVSIYEEIKVENEVEIEI